MNKKSSNTHLQRFIAVLFIFVLCITSFTGPLSMIFSNPLVVQAKDAETKDTKDDDKKDSKTDISDLGTLGKISTVKSNVSYDEDFQLLLTKYILNAEDFVSTDYAALYSEKEWIKEGEKYFGNKNISSYLLALEGDKDKSKDLIKELGNVDKAKAIYRLPIKKTNYDEKDNTKRENSSANLQLKDMFNEQAFSGDDSKESVKKGNLTEDDVLLFNKADRLRAYLGDYTQKDKKGVKELLGLNATSQYFSNMNGKAPNIINPKSSKTFTQNMGDVSLDGSASLAARMASTQGNIGLKTSTSSNGSVGLSMDSYGNVVTNKLEIVIPYWQNTSVPGIKELLNKNSKIFMSTPLMNNPEYATIFTKNFAVHEKVNLFEVISATSTDGNLYKSTTINKQIKSAYTADDTFKYTLNRKKELSGDAKKAFTAIYKEKTEKDAIAQFIVKKTKAAIKEQNTAMYNLVTTLQENKKTPSVLVGKTSEEIVTPKDKEETYLKDASTLLEKIAKILDVGLFEIIRLTIAGFVSDFYNANVISFSLGDIFHTSLLSDSALWQQMLNSVLLLIVSFTAVYVVFLTFKMLLGYVDAKEIMTRVAVLAVAVAAPMLLYSPLVNLIFNKPAELVLNTEMKRMSVLDVWLKKFEDDLADVTKDKPGFVASEVLRDKNQDYTLEFVTTTTAKGRKLGTESTIFREGKYPSKKNMVTVDVSVFDIVDWLDYLQKNKEKDKDLPTVPEVSLFDYLSSYSENAEAYEGIGSYTEFQFDTSVAIHTTSASYKGDKYSASDMIYAFMVTEGDYDSTLEKYNKVAAALEKLFYEGHSVGDSDENSSGTGVVQFNDDEIKVVESDLTMTKSMKEKLYGEARYSEFTREALGSSYNELTDIEKESDILGVESAVKKITTFRLYGDDQLNAEVGSISKTVLDKYASVYLPLRKTSNSSGYYEKSEAFILGLETFFAAANEYDVPYFPTGIETSNITLDTYIRSLFIPLSDFTPDNTSLDDVSRYVALNADLLSLIIFLGAICALMAYGLIKFVVLYALLMPFMLVSFFWNYVITNNKNSKAWLGVLTILVSFAGINLGLMLLWKGLIYAMTTSELNAIRGLASNPFPYTIANAAAVIFYLLLAYKFVLKPLGKAVKADMKNLGGEVFSSKIGDVAAVFEKGLGGMVNSAMGRTTGNGNNLGSVTVDDSASKKGLFAREKGQASALTDAMNGPDNDDNDFNEFENTDIQTINGKLNSNSNGPKPLIDTPTNDKSTKGGIRKLVNKTTNGAVDALKNGRKSFGSFVGGSLDKTVNKVGGKFGGKAANILGSVLGTAATQAITGETDKYVRGAEAVRDLAELSSKGLTEAGKFGGVFAGVLGKVAGRVKQPISSAEAKAVANKLNSNPMLGNKYDNLANMSTEELKTLEQSGLDTHLVSLDGGESNRNNELAYINAENETVSNLIAQSFTENGNIDAVADGNKILLNLDGQEFEDEATRSRVYNDLLVGAHDSINSLLGEEMVISDLGTSPLISQIGAKTFDLGNNPTYNGIIANEVKRHNANGAEIAHTIGPDGRNILTFANGNIPSILGQMENTLQGASKLISGNQAPSFGVDKANAKTFTDLLADNNIAFTQTASTNAETVAIQLNDYANDKERFDSLMETQRNLSDNISEIGAGNMQVQGNAIVNSAMKERMNNGELSEGEDFIFRGNDVIATSDKGKLALREIQETYDTERATTIAQVSDFAKSVSNSVLGVQGGLDTGIYQRHTDSNTENAISNSLVGKEHFVMRNDFDFGTSESLVSDLQRKRANISKGFIDSELLPQEVKFLENVDRMNNAEVVINRHDDSTVNVHTANGADTANLVSEYMLSYREATEARNVFDAQQAQQLQ